MAVMFMHATSFNSEISNWDVSSVRMMNGMFREATAFNHDLSMWDVSRVIDMSRMFMSAKSFNGDLSKWDVSSVTDMNSMFRQAEAFNSDLSNWDVSSVTDMNRMFLYAARFNRDLSKLSVSSVRDVDSMFSFARSFNRKLCGADWVTLKTSKHNMFTGSSGSISRKVCTTTAAVFSSRAELKGAVDACLKLSPRGDYSNGPHGPIAKWDVSRVTDMNGLFASAKHFNGDISKWDVSRVTDMSRMLMLATSFNCDLSRWDVSSVTNMDYMFLNAASFNQKLCGGNWFRSKASKNYMFQGSSGSISRGVCTSDPTPVTKPAPHQYASRRPIPERELIVRTPTSTFLSTLFTTARIHRMITCSRCGTFRKSGRASCCAPGGAWFKDCGGVDNANVDHMWSEGTKACKRKWKAIHM